MIVTYLQNEILRQNMLSGFMTQAKQFFNSRVVLQLCILTTCHNFGPHFFETRYQARASDVRPATLI